MDCGTHGLLENRVSNLIRKEANNSLLPFKSKGCAVSSLYI